MPCDGLVFTLRQKEKPVSRYHPPNGTRAYNTLTGAIKDTGKE